MADRKRIHGDQDGYDDVDDVASAAVGRQATSETRRPPSPSPPPPLRRRISVADLLNPNNPWILEGGASALPMLDVVPKHLRVGPWSTIATVSLFVLTYLLAVALIGAHLDRRSADDDVWDDFRLAPDAYKARTVGWWYNVAAFSWMVHMMRQVGADSALGPVAWTSYTLWSWTAVTARHGLCVLAPFVSSVRVAAEVLRLPVLLSASVTFGVWNFVLMPFIALVLFRDDPARRDGFVRYMTGFRLTQLHVFNLFYAVMNGAVVQPRRPLHLGDLDAVAASTLLYVAWYYLVLDRVGIHLYPIFSPRAFWVVGPWGLVVALCVGGYRFWGEVLSGRA